jgi:hypothetical protein
MTMSEHDPDATELLRAGRSAFRPDPADRDRVYASLSAALGASIPPAGAPPTGRTGGGTGASHLPARLYWVAGGLAAIVMGAGLVVVPHLGARAPAPAPAHRAPDSLPPPVEAPAAAPASSAGVPVTETTPPSRGNGLARPAARSSTHPPSDSLSEEVRLLSEAEEQLNRGLADDALKTLAEHERRFPTGALAEERMAARVQALCALGRTAEARSDLARLTRVNPRSAHLDRARRICGIDVGSP